MIIKDSLTNLIKNATYTLYGNDAVSFVLEHPNREEFGDYATNVALVLTKIVEQPPMEIAKNISYKIESLLKEEALKSNEPPLLEYIQSVAPGFINMRISPYWLNKLLAQTNSKNNNYGIANLGAGVRIALEHSNVNPNKAAHIGHLRNASIGQFLEKTYEALGYNVEVQYYTNNVGVQVATSMMGIENGFNLSPTDYKKFDHYAWDVYSKMESLIQEDTALQGKRLEILKKLEDPASVESMKQKELAQKILTEHLKTFAELGFDYDVIIYESDILAKKLWEEAFTLLKKNENVYKAADGPSKGCWLVKIEDASATDATRQGNQSGDTVEKDKIIVRSNGVATYTGKDIAYHMWKFGLLGTDFGYVNWETGTQTKPLWTTTAEKNESTVSFSRVAKVFDVIGVEQTYAIEAVKQSLKYLGYEKESENMKHINYGFVFLSRNTAEKLGIDVSDGRKFYAMSGRKGWGVKIDDLISLVDAFLEKTYGASDSIRTVRNGAIKFQMLKLNTFQDLIFDLDEALDIKGYSGTYIQYACVRANSVLTKAQDISHDLDLTSFKELTDKELSLLRGLYRYPEIVVESAEKFAPNVMCEYLYDLAKRFNSFYNDVPILKADDLSRRYRLALVATTLSTITSGLNLLGIEVPSKM